MKKMIPNILSLCRIPLGVLFVIVFLSDNPVFILAVLILLFSMLTDFFDGFLARKFNMVSEYGKWFDPISDFLFYFAVYLSFFIKGIMPVFLFVLFLFREFAIYVIIRPLYVKKKLEVGAKLPGKIKTVLNGIGVVAILVLCIFLKNMIINNNIFNTSVLIILSILVSYSILSLYWYIKVFFEKRKI